MKTSLLCVAEYPRRVKVTHISGFDNTVLQTTGMMDLSLRTQRRWREEFAAEKQRLVERREEAAAIRKMKDSPEKEARQAEFDRLGHAGEQASVLPNPVLYPIADDDDSDLNCDAETTTRTGIPNFGLIMRVDLQDKFGKEKSVMALQNTFGKLPESVMLEITEMMFKSSSSSCDRGNEGCTGADGRRSRSGANDASSVKLPRAIFLGEPKILRPFTRLMMHNNNEMSMEGFQTAGCYMHYYNRMMQATYLDDDALIF